MTTPRTPSAPYNKRIAIATPDIVDQQVETTVVFRLDLVGQLGNFFHLRVMDLNRDRAATPGSDHLRSLFDRLWSIHV